MDPCCMLEVKTAIQLLVEAHVKNNTKGVPNIAFRKRDVFT
jgi:hypothetical protein